GAKSFELFIGNRKKGCAARHHAMERKREERSSFFIDLGYEMVD
ncbi:MAG: hypothetical protein ACJAYL_002167, partial [Cryomorphaceae bacterium]